MYQMKRVKELEIINGWYEKVISFKEMFCMPIGIQN